MEKHDPGDFAFFLYPSRYWVVLYKVCQQFKFEQVYVELFAGIDNNLEEDDGGNSKNGVGTMCFISTQCCVYPYCVKFFPKKSETRCIFELNRCILDRFLCRSFFIVVGSKLLLIYSNSANWDSVDGIGTYDSRFFMTNSKNYVFLWGNVKVAKYKNT